VDAQANGRIDKPLENARLVDPLVRLRVTTLGHQSFMSSVFM